MSLSADTDTVQDRDSRQPMTGRRSPAWVVAGIAAVIVALGLYLTPPAYEAFVLLSVNPEHINDEWDLLKDQTRAIDFEEQIRSRAVLSPVVENAAFQDYFPGFRLSAAGGDPESALEGFRSCLQVQRLRHSSVLRIGVTMTSPEHAAKAANAVAESFIKLQKRQHIIRSQERLDALQQEIVSVQQDLARTLDERNAFLRERGWEDYDASLKLATDRVSALKAELQQLSMYGPDDAGYASVRSESDQTLSALAEKLRDVETRATQIRSRFKADSPPVEQVERERRDLESALSEYAAGRATHLVSQLDAAQKEMQNLLAAGPRIESYQASMHHAEKRFAELLDARSATRLGMALPAQNSDGFGSLWILDRAVPPAAAGRAQRLLFIGSSAAAAFLVSFSLVMLILTVWRYSGVWRPFLQDRCCAPTDKPL